LVTGAGGCAGTIVVVLVTGAGVVVLVTGAAAGVVLMTGAGSWVGTDCTVLVTSAWAGVVVMFVALGRGRRRTVRSGRVTRFAREVLAAETRAARDDVAEAGLFEVRWCFPASATAAWVVTVSSDWGRAVRAGTTATTVTTVSNPEPAARDHFADLLDDVAWAR
jgi:hypothetical protein